MYIIKYKANNCDFYSTYPIRFASYEAAEDFALASSEFNNFYIEKLVYDYDTFTWREWSYQS